MPKTGRQNRVQQALTRLKSRFNNVLFGAEEGVYVGQGRSGRVYWLPGTSSDWDSLAGDLWEVPAFAACFNYIWRNLTQPPAQVLRGKGKDAQPVPDHLLLALLKQPNPEMDWNRMLYGVLLSYFFGHGAFLCIERATRRGLPTQLWYIPHTLIKPKRDKKTGELYYEYRIRQKTFRIPKEDIVYIPHGMNPNNPLEGFAPLATAPRDGYVLQQGTNYAAKAMRNGGMVGLIVTPSKEMITDPTTTVDFDPETFVDVHQEKVTGERAGGIVAWNHPLDVHTANVTPQDMAIDTMLDRHEATAGALFGIPTQVVGLHVGRLSKTFANQKEAREIAWEECLVPTGNAVYGAIGAQLLPQMSVQAENECCCMDISQVRPLQPDLDAIYKRANDAWSLNLIDRERWCTMVGEEAQPGDKGLYFKDVQVEQQSAVLDKQGEIDKANQQNQPQNEKKDKAE